jgi:hypothetical protein
MTRQNVYVTDEDECRGLHSVLAGWFDLDRADHFPEGKRWDGSNNISLATGSQWEHEALYRTAGGRWVLNSWSQLQGTTPEWVFATEGEAREWLLRNEYSAEEVETATGDPVEDERGPGRPAVGPAVTVRFPEELLERVDAAADAAGLSRAAWLRLITENAVNNLEGGL